MPTIPGTQLEPPSDWQEFQRICCDLWKRIWRNPNVQEYGTIGQRQNGIDIFGRIDNGEHYGGVQCKDKDNLSAKELTVKELQEEANKAKRFSPPLREFILSYTGPRDVKLQNEANRLTENDRKEGLFSVSVWSWEEIKMELSNHLDLLQKYYLGQFGSTVATEQISKTVVSEVSDQVRVTGDEITEKLTSTLTEGFSEIRQEIKIQAGAELEAELIHIKKLIESYKPKTCIQFLDEIIRKKWDSISDTSRFKLLTNKASCLLQQEEPEEAGALFVRALQFDKDNEKALVNAALGYFLLDEDEKALKCVEQALQKNPLNLDAWSMKIQFSKDCAAIQKLVENVPKSFLEKTEINWARSVALQRAGSFTEAEKYMEMALKTDSERRIDLVVQLGSLKLKNSLGEVRLVGTGTLTPEFRSRLEASASLLTEAVKRLSESEIVPIKVVAITNRGVIHRILGEVDDAKKDLDQAIEWEPTDFEAAKQRAILSSKEGKYEEAIGCLKPYAENGIAPEAKILLADNYRLSKNHPEAIKTLQDCEQWQVDKEIKVHGLIILTECFLEVRNKPSALASVEKIKVLLGTSFVPFVFHARVERLLGQKDVAQRIALTAKSLLTQEIDFFHEWKLADELFALELFTDAADVYSRLAVPERNDGLTTRLIESHYRAGQWDRALQYCNRLRIHHPDARYATEIASVIYESTGNLQAAVQTLEHYLELKRDDDHAHLRLAGVLWRHGRIGEADRELGRIGEPESLGPKGILHYASLLSAKNELEKGIRLLYEARRKYSNDPEIEMGYIGFILGRGERIRILEDPGVVSVDTVVFLESDRHEQDFYIIEERADPDFLKKEINENSTIAKELIGKRIGEKVDLEKNPIQPRFWTIRDIKSKFGHAFRDAMNTHAKRFPERKDFLVFAAPTDEKGEVDAEEFRKQMLSALPDEGRRETLEDFYKQGKLTIGSFAKLAARDLLATTVYLASRRDLGIYSSTGSQAEYELGLRRISSSKGFVIEPISIIILELLKAKELLQERYGPFVIAQSTLDEFDKILAERSIGGLQPILTIIKHGGQLYRQEISAEDKKKQLDSLKSLVDWMRTNCVIKPVNLALAMQRDERDQMAEVFNRAVFDSLLLAKENGLMLYTEDGRLRGFAEKEHGVNGIWTHCLIKDALTKNFITEDQYNDYSISLLTFNINHVSITSTTLIAAAKKTSWRPEEPFLSVVFNLTGFRCDENSALIVAGDFLISLWTQALAPLARDNVVLALLDAITANRRRDITVRKIEILIANKFRLWPGAASALLAIVNAWKRTRMI
jgi:tetratricopeptide (TPR) repeat protein